MIAAALWGVAIGHAEDGARPPPRQLYAEVGAGFGGYLGVPELSLAGPVRIAGGGDWYRRERFSVTWEVLHRQAVHGSSETGPTHLHVFSLQLWNGVALHLGRWEASWGVGLGGDYLPRLVAQEFSELVARQNESSQRYLEGLEPTAAHAMLTASTGPSLGVDLTDVVSFGLDATLTLPVGFAPRLDVGVSLRCALTARAKDEG